MADPALGLIDEDRRSNWVRLRTLIVLRWIAVLGQIGAIAAAQFLFHLQLELGLCFLVIGTAIIANLLAIFIFPETKRLSEQETVGMLLFDVAQLSALLFLTGGLHNPFALLILAPVTISATALRPNSTVLLGAFAILLMTLIAIWHLPLRTDLGFILRVPRIFVFGSWVAIVIGVTFLGVYAWKVTSEIHSMSEAYLATQMALAREQKLTDLGGVVAAAAHELGTPLATIKLVSTELMDDLKDRPEAYEDAALIREQADRCRDILRSMGRAGKDDLLMHTAPLEAVIQEAAEPHLERGKEVHIDVLDVDAQNIGALEIARSPEIIHGLRNLVQNAVDFAGSTVWIEAFREEAQIVIRIIDDGAGFSPNVIGRIGDPFMRKRRSENSPKQRPGYEGMGLGLFIAKTLLERSGAELTFSNASDPQDHADHTGRRAGAIVEVSWPFTLIAQSGGQASTALGENRRFEA
ncbi:MAG: two-component system sensor histidine kinase RegB [Halocynthiibacter sp.]|jgi:two-component system sensor histidine kinase RegB